MKQRTIFDMDGKTYMSITAAFERWGISKGKILNYCKDGRIKAIKDSCGYWCIPVDTMKPLSDEEIQKLLFLTIQLKNNPALEIEWNVIEVTPENARKVYLNLYDIGMIRPFEINDDRRIPYDVVLTEKGLKAALTPKNKNFEFEKSLEAWISVIVTIVKLLT